MSFSRVAGRSAPTRTLGSVVAPTDVISSRLAGFGTTIFAEMSALAVETGAINLGQGFPDTDGPREVLDAAIESINGGLNQYPPLPGMPVLREAIAAHQQRFYDIRARPGDGDRGHSRCHRSAGGGLARHARRR